MGADENHLNRSVLQDNKGSCARVWLKACRKKKRSIFRIAACKDRPSKKKLAGKAERKTFWSTPRRGQARGMQAHPPRPA